VVLWVVFVAFLGGAALLVPHLSFMGLVWARLFAGLVNALVTAWSARKHCGVPLLATGRALARPMLGAICMYLVVDQLDQLVPTGAWQLLVGVVSGVLAYGAWALASWWLVGRPQGLESTVLEALFKRWRPPAV
uniref:polysaccharide biosynthesis C-terminal domain-containing protein n=1 Tax=Hydrogenophaga sp. TaxID=1904254 RepID=UPI003563F718